MQLKEVEALVDKEIGALIAHIKDSFSRLGIDLKEAEKIIYPTKDVIVVTYTLYRHRWFRKNVQFYTITVPIDKEGVDWKVRSHEPLICGAEGHFFKDIERIQGEFIGRLRKSLGIEDLVLLQIGHPRGF